MTKLSAVMATGLVTVALMAGLLAAAEGDTTKPAETGEKLNLIVNGSFETGPEFEASFLPIDEDSVAIRGWTVTRGQIDLLQQAGEQQVAAHGSRCLDLHGSPGWGGVEQPLVTKVGQRYKVTFSMSGNPGFGHRSVQLIVRAAGKKVTVECDMDEKSLADLGWEKVDWEFTAVDTLTVLEFRTGMTAANPFGGPLLDDVKVVALD